MRKNYRTVALLCLSRIIFTNPSWIQQQALFHYAKMIKAKYTDIELATRALQQAHPDSTKIIKLSASKLLENWLEDEEQKFSFTVILNAIHVLK